MNLSFEVTGQQLMRGCAGDLDEMTALVEVEVSGQVAIDAAVQARFRERAAVLCPDDALAGSRQTDWPTEFLRQSSRPEDDSVSWLGGWLAALTVAIQQWGRDAVWKGSVLRSEHGRLRLAIGYQRGDFFIEALGLATRLVREWLQPQPAPAEPISSFFEGRWPAIQADGLDPQTQRLLRAAVERGIPSDIMPAYVQIGWGASAERFDVTYTGRTSWMASAMAGNAFKSNRTLDSALVPVPPSRLVTDEVAAQAAAEELGWPVVLKTLFRESGFDTVPDINDAAGLGQAMADAAAAGFGTVVVEKQAAGCSHRVLIVADRPIAAVREDSSATESALDVTDALHPDNVDLALRAARVIGLDIAEVEIRSPDISRSWREVGAAVHTVEPRPDLGPYRVAIPNRDFEGEIFDNLGLGPSARIPTAAITGTNGKTTTTSMLHRIWSTAGRLTGMCTTVHVVIGDDVVVADNLSGHPGARMILNDPGVEAAVFEMPRKGLIYFGHPCDHYDVAALLNVQDDHIDADGIGTLEQMAELKAEVLARARHAAVVNADDPLCVAMLARAGTDRHVLVASGPDNSEVVEHRGRGGEAAFIDVRDGQRCIVLASGEREHVLMALKDVPATVNGLLRFNESNALFAAAIAWAQGVDHSVICAGLGSFHNSRQDNPGRYNLIDGLPFQMLVDFAHNPDGVREVCAVAAALPVSGRRLLCSTTVGSRHPHHFDLVAPRFAAVFDEFILGCDPVFTAAQSEYAGEDPSHNMVSRSVRLLEGCGVAPGLIATQTDPHEAIREALRRARPGDLVVLLAEDSEAFPVIDEFIATRTG